MTYTLSLYLYIYIYIYVFFCVFFVYITALKKSEISNYFKLFRKDLPSMECQVRGWGGARPARPGHARPAGRGGADGCPSLQVGLGLAGGWLGGGVARVVAGTLRPPKSAP